MTEKSLLYTVMALLGILVLSARQEAHSGNHLHGSHYGQNISYVNAYGGMHNPGAMQLVSAPLPGD